MGESYKDEMKILIQLAGSVFNSARRSQDRIDAELMQIQEMRKSINNFISSLPSAISLEVKEQIAGAVKGAAETIISRQIKANTEAERAFKAYERAARYSIWRLMVAGVSVAAIAIVSIALVAYIFLDCQCLSLGIKGR